MVENLFATDMSLLWSETCITEGLAQQQGSRFGEGIVIASATLWGSIAFAIRSVDRQDCRSVSFPWRLVSNRTGRDFFPSALWSRTWG